MSNIEKETPELVLPLSDIITRIDEEIAAVMAADIDGLALAVDDVTVDLTIATTTGAGGSVKVGVPPIEAQAGGKLEQVRSSRLVVQLGQPSASIAQGYDEDVLADFKLAKTIIEAQRQLAAGIAAGNKIAPQKLTLEIVFGVTESVEAKGGIKLWVFNVKGSGAYKQAGTNKITLKFNARTG